MTRVFGVGPGTFLLTFIWAVSTVVTFFFVKSRGNYVPGLACYVLSLASTSVLVSLRKTRKGSSIRGYDEDLGYDRMFIPRVLLLAFVIVSTIVGLVGLYATWWILPQVTTASKPTMKSSKQTENNRADTGRRVLTWATISKLDDKQGQSRTRTDNFVSRNDEIDRLRKRY
ncbi:uncharacterized protein LOC111266997 [Varroa jacobsoni]|uniref:Uncharacterized protein n=1 Tax=Varroa destructor TaxID=109461 RepID=A0A7M7KCE8_VARDE|nr:uncharacterized protein LOC111251924 [Varroa destructor]XP_022700648.1 uncharacterized protein LOC111266997 [Varroa jacobsoni]